MDDYQLTSTELEDRVAELFSLAGFNVSRGRNGKEDWLIEGSTEDSPTDS